MDNLEFIVLLIICGANLALNIIGYLNSRKTEDELDEAMKELTDELKKE